MTTGEFDPDIPVGEAQAFRPADPFGATSFFRPEPMSTPGGLSDPDIPVGEPGGFQPTQQFSPDPMAFPNRDFDPRSPSTLAGGHQPVRQGVAHPAGVGIRGAARLLDGALCGVVAALFAGVFDPNDSGVESYFVLSLIWGSVTFFYFVGFESAVGWTPAKKVLGLSVCGSDRVNASKPSFKQAWQRNLFMWPLIIPYVGFMWVAFRSIIISYSIARSPTKQGSHDHKADGRWSGERTHGVAAGYATQVLKG